MEAGTEPRGCAVTMILNDSESAARSDKRVA